MCILKLVREKEKVYTTWISKVVAYDTFSLDTSNNDFFLVYECYPNPYIGRDTNNTCNTSLYNWFKEILWTKKIKNYFTK